MSSDSTVFDVLLEISVKGTPRGNSYTTGYHYTGAEIKIEAAVKHPAQKWALPFTESSASKSCPFFISGSYKNPENAPFKSVYYKNKEFFSQLFSIIYLTKGIEPVRLAMTNSSLNKDIRIHVHYFAGETGDKRFVTSLLNSIASETGDIKKEAIAAVGKIGDPMAIPSLCIALLEDKNKDIRAKAAEALGQIGDPKVGGALSKALREDKIKNVRLKSAEALDKIGWKPTSTKEKVFYSLAKNKKQDITKMGKEVVPVLIEALNSSSSEIRQDSAEILGNLKSGEAVDPICRVLLEDTSLNVRKKSVEALGKIGDPKAIPSLCIALLEDKNKDIRAKAAEALGQIGDPKVVDALSKALLKDKIRNVRLKSAEALGKIGSKKAIQPLHNRLKTETDNGVKKAISHALLALGAEEKLPLEFYIETLTERKDWQKLRPLLQEQTTDTLIEQLKSKDKILKRMIAETLMQRTGKFDLGTDYNAWKNWSKKNKKP
jgi:HEAT repeat protein